MGKKEKIINIILNVTIVITSFLLFIDIVLNFQTTVLRKDYSSFLGYSIFEIKTGSMAGNIEIGDWILVKNTKNVELNDIITFEENDNFITHRVIENYSDVYVTKGDSNNSKDAPIKREQIVGKVVKVLPRFGVFKNVFLNAKVLIPFIIVLLIVVSLFDKKSNEKKINFLGIGKTKKTNDYDINDADSESVKTIKKVFADVGNGDKTISKTVVLSRIDVNMRSQTLNDLKDVFENTLEANKTLEKDTHEECNYDEPIIIGVLDEDNIEELL